MAFPGATPGHELHGQGEGAQRPVPASLLCLLDGFGLQHGGQSVAVPPGSQRLVAFLALQDRPVNRSLVSGSLWPDNSEPRAAACLRSAIWRSPSPGGQPLVESAGNLLRLGAAVQVDYHAAVAWATAVITGQAEAEVTGPGMATVSQELLPDWGDEWALVERERFRQLRLHALESSCEMLTRQGHYARALLAGLAAVAAEPLRESAHRLVVQAHLSEGNLYEAYRQYLSCAALLQTQLGVAPSAAMQALVSPLTHRGGTSGS